MSEEDTNISGDQLEAAAPATEEQSDVHPEQAAEEQHVPLAALQSERAQRQQMQDELKMMKEHLALLQARQPAYAEQHKDELDGLSDDDVLTVGEAKKFLNKMNRQYQGSLDELKMTQKYPDYQEVVTTYLPDVIKQNPRLAKTLQDTQDYELAYLLATSSDKYKAERKRAKKNADAERIVKNASQPGSLSSLGQTSPINKAKRYKDMSDEEFRREVANNLGYA